MTIGIGIFSIPYYFSNLGASLGAVILLLAALLNYFTFRLIFEVAAETKQISYIQTVKVSLGGMFYKISRLTLGVDYISIMVLYGIASYNFLQRILMGFNFFSDDDFDKKDAFELKEYSFKLLALRFIFFVVLFLVSIPNLLKKTMENMRYMSIIFLFAMITLLLSVVI